MTDEDFGRIAGEALDSLPDKFTQYLKNVAIVYAEEPTPEQRKRNHLAPNQTLLGLYEGIPQTRQSGAAR